MGEIVSKYVNKLIESLEAELQSLRLAEEDCSERIDSYNHQIEAGGSEVAQRLHCRLLPASIALHDYRTSIRVVEYQLEFLKPLSQELPTLEEAELQLETNKAIHEQTYQKYIEAKEDYDVAGRILERSYKLIDILKKEVNRD